jgi:hypothetical protein
MLLEPAWLVNSPCIPEHQALAAAVVDVAETISAG